MIAVQGASITAIPSYRARSDEELSISSRKSPVGGLKQKTPLSDSTLNKHDQDSEPGTATVSLDHHSVIPEILSFQAISNTDEGVNITASCNRSLESLTDLHIPPQTDDSAESLFDSQNEEVAFPPEEHIQDNHMRRIVSEIETNFQELFPLSPKPWKDRLVADGLESVSAGQ